MVFPKARLAVSVILFLAWIGYLAYLVAHTRDPVILSRPQLAVSSLVVVAAVEDKDGRPAPTVTLKVAWSLAGGADKLAGAQLTVQGLTDCGPAQGWRGAGAYILPLTKRGSEDGYEVTPLPLSPGYVPMFVTVELERVGPEKERVEERWAELNGETKANPVAGARRGNVPRLRAEEMKRKLEQAKASVKLLEGETRIYRATHDALEQLAELVPK